MTFTIKKVTIVFLTLILLNCSKSDDNSSTSGKIFTAKIDGENFSAREDLIFTLAINDRYLAIGGSNDNLKNIKTIDFIITMDDAQGLTKGLEITESSQKFYVEANFDDFDEDIDAWENEPGASYYIKIIDIDYDRGLISGEFRFTLIDDDLNKTIEITNGVFKNITF